MLVESTAIDLLDVKKLTNRVRGFGSRAGSRGSTSEIQATLGAQRVEITHPGVLININRTFRPNMDVIDLYDATRSAWKIGRRREAIRFAFSVYGAVIREIFLIEAWVRGGATLHAGDINGRPTPRPGRWEFVGRVADDDVRDRYLGRSVAHYFSIGSANPIRYVGDV